MTAKESFDIFIAEHLERTHKIVGIYIKNPQDAEDVVAESIEKALRNIHTLKDPSSMRIWFYKIAVHTSLNHLKRRSHSVLISSRSPIIYIEDCSQLAFKELLEALPYTDRQIVYLRFCDNCRLKEIAETMQMKESTVKTRLYRALKKLELEITEAENGLAVSKQSGRSVTMRITALAAALLLSSVCVFNLFPTLAIAAYEIPVVGDIVKAITLNRFSYKDKNYEADIIVPEIQGLLDQQLQDRLNAEFKEFADELTRSFEATIMELDDESAFLSIKADYEVKANTEKVLSIDAYLFSDVNGLFVHKYCTIDKSSGMQVTLAGLFKPDADYITPISRYIVDEMIRLNKEEDATFSIGNPMFEDFTEIRPDNNFYINADNNLVICFDKYEVAAGIQGSPEFVIPNEIIIDILS